MDPVFSLGEGEEKWHFFNLLCQLLKNAPCCKNGKEMLENNNKIGLNIFLGWEWSWSSLVSSIPNPIHMYHHHPPHFPHSKFEYLGGKEFRCILLRAKGEIWYWISLAEFEACFCMFLPWREILIQILRHLSRVYRICSLVVVNISTTYNTFWTKCRMNELEETSKSTQFSLVMHS